MGSAASSVTKSVPRDPSEPVTEEFVVDVTPEDPTAASQSDDSGASNPPEDLEEVFSYGTERVYRFERSQDRTCFCECIEQFGCQIGRAHV